MDDISISTCWCGCVSAQPSVHPAYIVCEACGTCRLADVHGWAPEVVSGGEGIYGEHYWREHMTQDFGYPAIEQRSIDDLAERCLYWLMAIMRYTSPPGRAIELGCAHGGFVKMLSLAGFNAVGLEMDDGIIAYAQKTFGVSVVKGPLEAVDSPPTDFGLCCMFDVIEHLPTPQRSLNCISKCMNEGGVLVLQTPEYDGARNEQWSGFKVPEHLYLFTRESMRRLLETAGFSHVHFEEPCFPTDMFVLASRAPLRERTEAEIGGALLATPGGRILHAMLSLRREAAVASESARRLKAENVALQNSLLSARLGRLFRGQARPVDFLKRVLRRCQR